MLHEAANKATPITGGADGLAGMDRLAGPRALPLRSLRPHRLFYCLAVLFLVLACRAARSCTRRSAARSPASARTSGACTRSARRSTAAASPSTRSRPGMAGVAGALIAQTTAFVALERLELRALRRDPHHADPRRGRPALRRLHRRAALHDRCRTSSPRSIRSIGISGSASLLVLVVLFAPRRRLRRSPTRLVRWWRRAR